MNTNVFCNKCHRIPSQCLCRNAPKELSDEEIIEVFEKPFHKEPTGKINDEVIAFARAILKKASEK